MISWVRIDQRVGYELTESGYETSEPGYETTGKHYKSLTWLQKRYSEFFFRNMTLSPGLKQTLTLPMSQYVNGG